MSIGWDQAEKMAAKHGSELYVQLPKNGDTVVGVFVGDPYAREVHWTGERYEPCKGKACKLCKEGKPSMRVCLNFYVPEDETLKIIEGGTRWFKDVLKVRDKYGLENRQFEVQRHGEGTKTTYSIMPDNDVNDELRETLDGLDLHDLEAVVNSQGSGEDEDEFDSYDKSKRSNRKSRKDKDDDDPPKKKTRPKVEDEEDEEDEVVDAKQAADLVSRLKSLPRDAADEFLKRFKIKKIRQLPAAQAKKAEKFVAALEAEYAEEEDDEKDPFA